MPHDVNLIARTMYCVLYLEEPSLGTDMKYLHGIVSEYDHQLVAPHLVQQWFRHDDIICQQAEHTSRTDDLYTVTFRSRGYIPFSGTH